MSNYTDIGSARQGRGFREVCRGNRQPSDDHGDMEHRGRGGAGQPGAVHRGVRGQPGSGGNGVSPRRARGDGPTGVPSRRPAEAVSLRLYEQDPLVPESHAGVRAECGAVVSAEPAAAGLSHHRGLPHGAPEAAQKDICRLRALVPGDEDHGWRDAVPGRHDHPRVQRPKAVHQCGAQPEEAGVRPGAAGGRGALSGRHGRKRPPRGSNRPPLRAGSGQGSSARPADAPGAASPFTKSASRSWRSPVEAP